MMDLYHVAPAYAIDGIAERGLVPGTRRSGMSGTIPLAHLEGAIFLTAADGLSFWYSRAEEAMVHESDNPHEEGHTPIVLRTPTPDECEEDELGTRDAGGAEAFRCQITIPPEELEFFDGKDWRPVDEWDDDYTDQAWDEDGDFLAETPLLPEWGDLEENPRARGESRKSRNSRKSIKRRLMR